MDGQDDPPNLKVYRRVQEGRADESGLGGRTLPWRLVGLPLVQGRLGAFVGLRSQSLGKAWRPWERDCREQAGCLRAKQGPLRFDWQGRDPKTGLASEGWTLPPLGAKEATGKWGKQREPRKRNIQFSLPSDTFRGQLGWSLPLAKTSGLGRGRRSGGTHVCPLLPV